MDILPKLIILTILIEAIVSYGKMIVAAKMSTKVTLLSAITIGIAFSYLFKIDFLPLVGLNTSITIVGNIVTGIVISRGSNFLYDLIDKLGITGKPTVDKTPK